MYATMLTSLLINALLMGLAGLPHCAAMCGAPCAAALPRGLSWSALAGRVLGYALLGAVAAGATSALSSWSRWAGLLQPVWVMVLAAAIMMGGWMAWRGTMPAVIQNQGLRWYRQLADAAARPGGWLSRPWAQRSLPVLLGMAWAALPCGLLYGAVVVAALAPSAWEGALVMVVFSLPGTLALAGVTRWLGSLWSRSIPADPALAGLQASATVPVLWVPGAEASRQKASAAAATAPVDAPARSPWLRALTDPRWAVRLSGVMLAGAASWALAHRLLEQWQAWCA